METLNYRYIKSECFEKLEALGWYYNIMEAGYTSLDKSTIAIDGRVPYYNRLMQFRPHMETEHAVVVAQLDTLGFLHPAGEVWYKDTKIFPDAQ